MNGIAIALVLGVLAVIVQRLVTVIKKAAEGGWAATGWLALHGFLGVSGAWLLAKAGVTVNLFEAFGAQPTLAVALTTGLVVGLLGTDIYNLTEYVRQRRIDAETSNVLRGSTLKR